VQETFLRAWRGRDKFEGSSAFRAWLYRIATNVCLDAIRRRNRRPPARTLTSLGEVPWLQPYPDQLLDDVAPREADVAPREAEPDAVAVRRETIELAYLAAIQLLPPRQRAVLILRDVLDFSAAETAAQIDMTTVAVNSALQRARATLRSNPPHGRTDRPPTQPTDDELAILRRFIDAHERADVEAATAMLREDARVAMPPNPFWFNGREVIVASLMAGLRDPGEWRLVPVRANRQPAAASYLRPWGSSEFEAFKFDILRIEGCRIAEITTFDATLFPVFGLAPVLEDSHRPWSDDPDAGPALHRETATRGVRKWAD
jgi:RNA polymerase sigma-70 factor (ECF subfamily)